MLNKELVSKIEIILGSKIIAIERPNQGFDSDVWFIKDSSLAEYVVKISEGARNDYETLKLIEKNSPNIPIPKLIGGFEFEEKFVLILSKINLPLLESIQDKDKHLFIPSMISNLRKIHEIKSEKAGLLVENGELSWKELLLQKYSGNHPWYNWEKLKTDPRINRALIDSMISKLTYEIKNSELIDSNYSLLHTDFNQSNLFVDPEKNEIAGIIDWSEAMFGDPLYDFARVHLFILHFNSCEEVLNNFYEILRLNKEQKVFEELYLNIQLLDYLNWYAERDDEFCNSRIELHQNLLQSSSDND